MHSHETETPPRQNRSSGIPICSRCSKKMERLRSMSRHDAERDWFKCEACGHLITRARDETTPDTSVVSLNV